MWCAWHVAGGGGWEQAKKKLGRSGLSSGQRDRLRCLEEEQVLVRGQREQRCQPIRLEKNGT